MMKMEGRIGAGADRGTQLDFLILIQILILSWMEDLDDEDGGENWSWSRQGDTVRLPDQVSTWHLPPYPPKICTRYKIHNTYINDTQNILHKIHIMS